MGASPHTCQDRVPVVGSRDDHAVNVGPRQRREHQSGGHGSYGAQSGQWRPTYGRQRTSDGAERRLADERIAGIEDLDRNAVHGLECAGGRMLAAPLDLERPQVVAGLDHQVHF